MPTYVCDDGPDSGLELLLAEDGTTLLTEASESIVVEQQIAYTCDGGPA